MARDVFVRFKNMPRIPDIERSLLDYVSDGASVRWSRDRWMVDLPGVPEETPTRQPTRWIEVWVGSNCVDVMTRQADEFTNAIADGLAARLARWFDGLVEAG